MVALVRKIDRGLQARGKFEQRRIDLVNARRQSAFELIESRARLQRRDGFDEILYGLCLHQIDTSMQIGAKRELARLGQPRSRLHGGVDDRAQEHGAAVRADLQDVFTRVGMRRGKERQHRAIDRGLARTHMRERGVPGLQRRRSPGQRQRDVACRRSADANDPDAATAWRRCDRHDRIVGGVHGGKGDRLPRWRGRR